MSVDPTKLCQLEIYVAQVEEAARFYGAVFGWQKVPVELNDYVVLTVPAACPFGIALVTSRNLDLKAAQRANKIVPYFNVENLSALVEKAVAAGATLRMPRKKLPGYGEICQLDDPFGQTWGFRQES